MNNLCADIGYLSMNKFSEGICGDMVEVAYFGENSFVAVLADGLGSGVKANILSTLTSKIIATMLSNSMKIEDCIATVAASLPICKDRRIAYSTFTVIRVVENEFADIIQYDNPPVIMFRDEKRYNYPATVTSVEGKTIYISRVWLQEGDTFVMMSDGAIHTGAGGVIDRMWGTDEIAEFLQKAYDKDIPSKAVSTFLLEECKRRYEDKPGDDTTVCTIKIKRRNPVNLLMGPPKDPKDVNRMMSLFFAKEGKHIVSGGTTATLAAEYLNVPLIPSMDYYDADVPPTSEIEGVELVTEGVLTINKVLEYAKDYLGDNVYYNDWCHQLDGASQIAKLLFEEATDINFFVGRAVNPAHQNSALPIDFSIKMRLVEELSECLKKMGKRILVNYF